MLRAVKSTILLTVKSHFYGRGRETRSLGHSIEKDSDLFFSRKEGALTAEPCSTELRPLLPVGDPQKQPLH